MDRLDVSPATTSSRRTAIGPARRELGAELRRLRRARVRPDGRATSQEQAAALLLLGGKPAVSRLETGARVPDPTTVALYVECFGGDPTTLARLVDAARTEPNSAADPGSGPSRPEVLLSAPRRRRPVLVVAAIAVALLIAAGTALVVAHPWRAPDPSAHFLEPVGTVSLPSPLHGTVTGWTDDDLWVDVQAVSETRHHPMNHPCARQGVVFACDPVYAGRPSDTGTTFRLSLLAVPRGGPADQALVAYGSRDTDAPDAYVGMASLPAGVQIAVSELVVRT